MVLPSMDNPCILKMEEMALKMRDKSWEISLQKERQYTVQEKQDLLNMIKTAVVLMGVLLK